MRPNHLTLLIACSVVILLWAATYPQSGAEAQSAARDETSRSPSHAWAAEPAMSPAAQLAPAVHAERTSVSLSPAVSMVKCKLGQSYSQTLTLTNQTSQELAFEMMAEDVVVRDGKRVFVAAGETPAGIAATAVFGQKEVVVKPQQSSSVVVTFTVPQETPLRAVVAAFHGSTKISNGGVVKMTASLGTLFTFTASENFRIETSPIVLIPQSATANLGISQTLINTGSEPVVADGVAAVLDQAGAVVGKAAFEQQRLLPGERLPFRAEYSAELKTGHYRLVASFQYEERVITSSIDFTVP